MSARYLINRLLAMLPVLLFVSVAIFSFTHLLPGDPVLAIIGDQSFDEETLNQVRQDLGLDRPLPVQYLTWLGDVITGDLGRSSISRQPVVEALIDRLPVTLHLAIASIVIATLIAVPAGVLSAYRRNSVLDRVVTVIGLAGLAMPNFWLGILLILLFAVTLGWLPPSGFVSVFDNPIECFRYLILPSLVLGSSLGATLMRQIRSSLLEVLAEDYVRTARAKGLTEQRVVITHGLRNALLPVVTIFGLQVSRVLGGSVIIETVFAMPGVGRYTVGAIFARDYPVVMATVLLAAVIVIVVNFATDMIYSILDPRIRLA